MSIRSEPTRNPVAPPSGGRVEGESRRSRPNIGVIPPGQIERAFTALLYLAIIVLIALSVLGTFYGRRGASAPIAAPARLWADISAAPGLLGIALAVQVILMVTQYGARQFAARDRRWWLLYLVALGISVYYNVQAYWAPLTVMVPWYVVGVLIVAGDILPEFIAVRRE